MLNLAGPPHADQSGDQFLAIEPGALDAIRGALEARPAPLCETDAWRRTAPLSGARRATARRTASRLPRASSTAVMLSAHCSKVGSAPDCDGIRRTCARLVEENQPTERCHRLDPALDGR